jgi:hypothetical protein
MERPIQAAWDALKSSSSSGVRRRLGRRPEFDDDKVSMPLQAADLHAWWMRRGFRDETENRERLSPIWKQTKELTSIGIRMDEAQIFEFFASISTALRQAASISSFPA